MASDSSKIALNTVEKPVSANENTGLNKMRGRMAAEGYQYHSLPEEEDARLGPMNKFSLKSATSREKNYMCFLVIALLLIACLAAALVWQYITTSKQLQELENRPCNSASCVKNSAYILNKIDTNVNPCDDFYSYACGNWEKTTHFPATKAKYTSFTEIGEQIEKIMKEIVESPDSYQVKGRNSTAVLKAKQFYQICMDTDKIKAIGTTPILQLIKDLGSWTVTSDSSSGTWDADSWELQEALTKAYVHMFSPLFSFGVGADEKNSSRTIIKINQGGLTLRNKEEYFTNHSNYEEIKDAFLQYTTKVGELLGGDNSSRFKMEEVYNFEQRLASIFYAEEELIDPKETYHKMTVKELQDLVGDWLDVQKFMSAVLQKNINLSEEILSSTPNYFPSLAGVLKTTPKEVLANYIVMEALSSTIGYMPDAFIDASLILDKVESGITELEPRWKRCLQKTNEFGYATGALYVQENFAENSKGDVVNMFEELRKAFIDNLPAVSWMDDMTRNYAKQKAEAVGRNIGYPDWILDQAELDKYYEKLIIGKEESFYKVGLLIRQFYSWKRSDKHGKPPNKKEWSMSPTDVNGYYSLAYNHIVFPAGILRPPLYNPDLPKSFNFGSFGFIVGHELTHGFDNIGKEFNKYGNMENWWTNTSAQGFLEHSQCCVDQYSNYEMKGVYLNGKTTLSENIADNGGLKMALAAYRAWRNQHGEDSLTLPGLQYTADQLFFLGSAQVWCTHITDAYIKTAVLTDVHSLAKFRVIGPLSNSDDFSKAFSCPPGSTMNPQHKCYVW
ncbi:hypothetical protein CHS0354_003048 [Potamilus streckersoni]|uniref:Endothelin-converting enzyme 1 n=1 Tax=Potamilus streckersoni TaxID=2493646 RepID=A0AAE0WBF4_9BIVA|nr:hypothetical protein CHS0354_003048 [Potamilus streckersoni]